MQEEGPGDEHQTDIEGKSQSLKRGHTLIWETALGCGGVSEGESRSLLFHGVAAFLKTSHDSDLSSFRLHFPIKEMYGACMCAWCILRMHSFAEAWLFMLSLLSPARHRGLTHKWPTRYLRTVVWLP